MNNNCENVISISQFGPTCWFNSILMALLYSDQSRKLLLKKSKKWNKNIEVLNTINYILHNKYLRTDKIYKDYEYFDKIRPEYILNELYKYNNKKFIIDPKFNKHGYKSALYIRKIYKLLGVKVLYLDLNTYTNNLYYSLYNNIKVVSIEKTISFEIKKKSYSTIIKNFKNPDVIIISLDNNLSENLYPEWYNINNPNVFNKYKNNLNDLKKLNNEHIFNNNIYEQDSILLTNYNKNLGGHSISGITCKGDRYVYNGWTRTTIDPNMKFKNNINSEKTISIPCQLMKFNWELKKNKEFCLNPSKCILDEMNVRDLCFSFDKGSREVIYVKKNKLNETNIKNICNKEYVINPLSNRCIKKENINKIPNIPLTKPEKICPEGKIINPKTGRCIKINKFQ